MWVNSAGLVLRGINQNKEMNAIACMWGLPAHRVIQHEHDDGHTPVLDILSGNGEADF